MAIIVRHREDGRVFVLIGTGYGAYQSARPGLIGGNLFPHEEEGEIPVAAVSDKEGNIHWFYTEDLRVVEIGGLPIRDVLAPYAEGQAAKEDPDSGLNLCPACKSQLSWEDGECPSCGLVFQQQEE